MTPLISAPFAELFKPTQKQPKPPSPLVEPPVTEEASKAKEWEPPEEAFKKQEPWSPPEEALLKPEAKTWSPPVEAFAGVAEKDVDPDSLTTRKAAGESLSMDQERILWKKGREKGLGTQAVDFFKALPGAAWDAAVPLVKGAATAVKDLAAVQIPYEGDSPEIAAEKQAKLDKAVRVLRHIPIGAVNAGEDIVGIPFKASLGGSAITDKFKELPKPLQFVISPIGAIASGPQQTEEQSFQNSLARQDFDAARAKDNAENPDRAAIGMARLAEANKEAVIPFTGGAKVGDMAPSLREAALKDVGQNMVQFFDFLAPGIGEEQLLRLGHKPLQHVMSAAATTAQKGLLGVKAPEIIRNIQLPETVLGLKVPEVAKKFVSIDKVGVAPLVEKTGSGFLGLHTVMDKKVRQLSYLISGDENSLFRHLLDPIKPFTWVPGKGMQSTGRFFTDLGRTVDKAGAAGRQGFFQRAARSPESSELTRKLLEDKSYLKARFLDAASSVTGYYTSRGIEGGIVQMALGLGNVEDGKSAGEIFGSGMGLGTFSASMPHTFLPAMEEHRRVAENADILRAMTAAGKETENAIEAAVSPKVLSASYAQQARDLQAKIDASYSEAGGEAKRKELLGMKLKHEAAAAFWATVKEDHPGIVEAKRMAKLGFTDLAEVMRPILKSNGFGDTEIKVMTADQIAAYYKQIYGAKLSEAQAVLSDPNAAGIDKAEAANTIQQIEISIADAKETRGHALSEKSYPAGESPVKGAVVILNASHRDNLLSKPGNFESALRHEVAHALEEYGQAVNLRDQVAPDLFAKYFTDPVTGEKTPVNDGLYTDEDADADAEVYLSRFSPEARARLEATAFNTPEKRRTYMRAERFAESIGLSAEAGQLLQRLNSPVQAILDWAAAKSLNGRLGAFRDALVQSGKLPGLSRGDSTILNAVDAQSLALTRNYLRAMKNYQDRMLFHVDPANDVQIPILRILKSPKLQEKFKEIDLFVTDVGADVFDSTGKKVASVKILDPSFASGGEYSFKGGRFEDADGNETVLPLEVQQAVAALPGETKINIGTRIVRNPDGTPKLLSGRETKARASARGEAIQKALDTAPDVKAFPNAMKDTGNGSYRGVMTPGQLAAVKALPEILVANSLKRKIFAFNAALGRGDGTRFLINYQPVYRGGKARALSPKFRDVVPIGFQFTKDHNFLAVNASVSRMFDKLNYYSLKMPEKLALWAGDQTAFINDLAKYLQNHAANIHGEGEASKPETLLASDIGTALEKKNILNDFLNMFDADTANTNPVRTKIKAKKGQDSPDRIIMSARMDRITDIEESAAQKLPIKYDLVKRNFMPGKSTSLSVKEALAWAEKKPTGTAILLRSGEVLHGRANLYHAQLALAYPEKFGFSQKEAKVFRQQLQEVLNEDSAWAEDTDEDSLDWSDDSNRIDSQISERVKKQGAALLVGMSGDWYLRGVENSLSASQQKIVNAMRQAGHNITFEGPQTFEKKPTLIQQARAIPDDFTDTTPKFMPSQKVKDIPTAKLGELLAHFDADAEAGGLDYADWDGIAKFRSLYSRLTREEILDDLAMRMDLEDSILDNLTVKALVDHGGEIIADVLNGKVASTEEIQDAQLDMAAKIGAKRYGAGPKFMPSSDGFYSSLETGLFSKLQGKAASKEQALALLQPGKVKGIKPEEVKWSGILPKIEELASANNGKVPLDELRSWMTEEARYNVEEVNYGQAPTILGVDVNHIQWEQGELPGGAVSFTADLPDGSRATIYAEEDGRSTMTILDPDGEDTGMEPEYPTVEAAMQDVPAVHAEALSGNSGPGETKFSGYQIPGGKNYRELVLTMKPENSFDPAKVKIERQDSSVTQGTFRILYNGKELSPWYGNSGGTGEYGKLTDDEIMVFAKRNFEQGDPISGVEKQSEGYSSTHFPGVDYVAHLRRNDRVDSSGEEGTLAEEFQSDRHQEGRKHGYQSDKKVTYRVAWDYTDPTGRERHEESSRHKTEEAAQEFVRQQREKIADENAEFSVVEVVSTGETPDAPYKKDWPLALFKRLLRDAIAEGKQWVGWTAGIDQVKRYENELRKAVDQIEWADGGKPGAKTVVANKNGKPVFVATVDSEGKILQTPQSTVLGKSLEDVVGKSIAAKILGAESGDIKDKDLSIGGEGMKGFYDDIMPKEVGKYVSQWNVKVEEGTLGQEGSSLRNFDSRQEAYDWAEKHLGDHDYTIHRDTETGDGDPEKFFVRDNYTNRLVLAEKLTPFWKVKITPEMKAEISTKGQPRFMPSESQGKNFEENSLQFQENAVKRLQHHENPTFQQLGNRIRTDSAWRLADRLGIARKAAAEKSADRRPAPENRGGIEAEITALEQLPEIDFTGLDKIGGASEHDLFEDADPGFVLKTTLPGEFGGIQLDENGRPSYPSEYARRVAISNVLFQDNIQIIGRVGKGKNLQLVIRQPWVDSLHVNGEPVPATDPEIQDWMAASGFIKVLGKENQYDHPAGIRVYDAGVGNVLKTPTGFKAIDVMPVFRPLGSGMNFLPSEKESWTEQDHAGQLDDFKAKASEEFGHEDLDKIPARKILSWARDWRKANPRPSELFRFMPAQVEDFPLSPERLEELKKDRDVMWHGSVSGDLRGGQTGLHVGTYQAAKEALEAQIGIPAEGEWDGTREYSKTLLMGTNRQQEIRKNATTEKDKFFGGTGYNARDAKSEDHYPAKELKYSNGDPAPANAKPSITPFRITGKMSNSFWAPHGDWAANGRMRGMLKRGKARSGYYYMNESEDAGRISAVLPDGSFLAQIQYLPSSLPGSQGFYSRLQKGLEDDRQHTFSADQAKALGKKVTNEEELKWTGFFEAVDAIAARNHGKVPKNELLEHLANEGNIQFEEIRLGNPNTRSPEDIENGGMEAELRGMVAADNPPAGWQEISPSIIAGETRNTNWTLPGGENHTELILKAPEKLEESPIFKLEKVLQYEKEFWAPIDLETGKPILANSGAPYLVPVSEYTKTEAKTEFSMSLARKRRESTRSGNGDYPFPSSDTTHYSDLKALAWIRMDDRNDIDGNPGRLAQELQSKYHQEGREKGYKPKDPLNPTDEEIRQFYDLLNDRNPADYREEMINDLETMKGNFGIPDAPFKKDWSLQLFKRMLRDAIADGKEWVGWTDGKTQADRYSLAKQVSKIETYKNDGKSVNLVVRDLNGKIILDENSMSFDKLAETIGKELAEKIVNQPVEEKIDYAGENLEIGGKGMKGFYDSMLPKMIGKYIKQWGGKVEASKVQTTKKYNEPADLPLEVQNQIYSQVAKELHEKMGSAIDEESDEYLFAFNDREGELFNEWVAKHSPAIEVPIWKVEITPEMVKSVMSQGQPKFMPSVNHSQESRKGGLEEVTKESILGSQDVRGGLQDVKMVTLPPEAKKGLSGGLRGVTRQNPAERRKKAGLAEIP
ncbi:MAG: hypothetical protein M0Q93_01050 [Terrimicrobiaceae bacterium]|nr:hypothetical protein [Terrimicrobiaceae bacterium]